MFELDAVLISGLGLGVMYDLDRTLVYRLEGVVSSVRVSLVVGYPGQSWAVHRVHIASCGIDVSMMHEIGQTDTMI